MKSVTKRYAGLFLLALFASCTGMSQSAAANPGNPIYDTAPAFTTQGPDPSIRQEIVPYVAEPRPTAEAGTIIVEAIVNVRGIPMNVHLFHGIGGGWDEKAIQLVHQDRFKPAMKDGKPVTVVVRIKVIFPAPAN